MAQHNEVKNMKTHVYVQNCCKLLVFLYIAKHIGCVTLLPVALKI